MQTTEELLAERGKSHGPYRVHAECAQKIKLAMRSYDGWHNLTFSQREALEMIAHKIGRIIVGDPNVTDHWDDIAGYATLASRDIAEPGPGPELDLGPAGFIKWTNGDDLPTLVTSQLKLPF